MSRRFASQAEYYRHHKACFDLALEMGVTPREAELELERREVSARFAETHARFLAAQKPMNAGCNASSPANDQRWMMRD
jgi:hypothetical protein